MVRGMAVLLDPWSHTYAAGMHMVLSVRLPDRPGALGQVASRLGALGANITDIRVARSGGEMVDDVFHVTLPAVDEVDLVALAHTELNEVDGVSITAWHSATCCGT